MSPRRSSSTSTPKPRLTTRSSVAWRWTTIRRKPRPCWMSLVSKMWTEMASANIRMAPSSRSPWTGMLDKPTSSTLRLPKSLPELERHRPEYHQQHHPGSEYGPAWRAGQLSIHAHWEVGDGPDHLLYPSWVVPDESDRWGPLCGALRIVKGTELENAELEKSPWERQPARFHKDDPSTKAPPLSSCTPCTTRPSSQWTISSVWSWCGR